MKKNNKGFTLVELLGVLVILISIILIAIPTITSSIERSKEKQLVNKKELIISAAELYISDIKTSRASCIISIATLKSENYISNKSIIDPYSTSNEEITGFVLYTKSSSGINYKFCSSTGQTGCNVTVNCN